MVSIDEVQLMLDEIAESLPPEFYEDLNGGIILLPEEKLSPQAKNNDLYILGEYHRGGPLGRYISIFYGSFARMFSGLSAEDLKKRLGDTLLHEFTHHLESLAGEKGLEKWDEEQMRAYLERYRQSGRC